MRGRPPTTSWARSAWLVVVGATCISACEPENPLDSAIQPPTAASRVGEILAPSGDAGFAHATVPRPFEFPRDHGPHPEYRHEWWYVTGHLDGAARERFGFELTFFRLALAPPAERAAGGSSWRTRQIYVAHFAVTDIARRRFHSVERRSRDALGLSGAQLEPVRIWLDDWTLTADREAAVWHLHAGEHPLRLDLELRTRKPPVANGTQGLSRKSAQAGNANFYYSIPRLEVRGELDRGEGPVPVSGTAWIDREWGTGGLAPNQQGWDWFGLQLRDGSELMFYALRRRDGSRDPFSAGTWIDRDGDAWPLANTEVEIEVGAHWSSRLGGRYPARWRLRVPRLALDLDIRPALADQELDTTPRYWEGAVDVIGTRAGAQVDGRGYVELTGYAN